MPSTGTFEVVKGFTFNYLPEPTVGGGWYFGGGKQLKPGDQIEITKAYVDGFGSDPWPEREAKLPDGTIGRIGLGVTVARGHLRPVPPKEG